MVLQWCFFYPVYKMSTRRSASKHKGVILTYYSFLSFSKFDQDGTWEGIFDFLNSYLMSREKPPTNDQKPLKMGF